MTTIEGEPNPISYKGYDAIVQLDAEDEVFVGHVRGVSGIVGFHAATAGDLRDAFHEAVEDYLETCAAIGRPPN